MGDGKRAHFVFIPLMAMGHVIPVIDTALLLAKEGALCSIVVTPSTAARVRPCIPPVESPSVRLLEFPLEYVADGADNLDNIPADRFLGYFPAVALLRAPVEERLRRQDLGWPRVTCIVSDFTHPWTGALAASLGVPRLSFFPMCAMAALWEHSVHKLNLLHHDGVGDEAAAAAAASAPVVVPLLGLGLGEEKRVVELARAHTPCFLRQPWLGTLGKEMERAEADGDGAIISTCLELEPDYVRGLAHAWGKQVWTVGPVSLLHQSRSSRGEAATVDADEYLRWLDGKDPGSVVYVSFGTIAPRMEPELLLELGLGLETSGHPFIWVLNKADDLGATLQLQELQARVAAAGHGRVARGWVPQLPILSHPAVGCFLTHAGWNSILEAITAGKPVVTWPRMACSEHYVNEKLAVGELGVGLSVRPKEKAAAEPDRHDIRAVLTAVLLGGEEGQQRRSRARALAAKARAAMQPGGSSHANLCHLVNRFTT